MNLTKSVQDHYAKNYKIFIKQIKDDLNKWRATIFVNWEPQHNKDVTFAQINIQVNIIPKKITRFS